MPSVALKLSASLPSRSHWWRPFDEQAKSAQHKRAGELGGRPGKPVVVNGVRYKSAFAAKKSLRIGYEKLYQWIREGKAVRL